MSLFIDIFLSDHALKEGCVVCGLVDYTVQIIVLSPLIDDRFIESEIPRDLQREIKEKISFG